MRTVGLLLASALFVLVGCEPDIDAGDYDRSCGQASDCFVIFTGPVCSCDCTNAAINVSERDQYFEDREGPDCDTACGACPAVDAVCNAGMCDVTSP